jgi:hypothetical protein
MADFTIKTRKEKKTDDNTRRTSSSSSRCRWGERRQVYSGCIDVSLATNKKKIPRFKISQLLDSDKNKKETYFTRQQQVVVILSIFILTRPHSRVRRRLGKAISQKHLNISSGIKIFVEDDSVSDCIERFMIKASTDMRFGAASN